MSSFEYSVIRYVDDIAINEPINIGIMIGEVDTKILVGKLIDDVSVIRKIHKKADIRLIESVIKTLRGQQEYDNTLSMMAKKFQYQLRFTEPRAAITDNKEKTLNDLYERYVSIVKNFPVKKIGSHKKIRRYVDKSIANTIKELDFDDRDYEKNHVFETNKRAIKVDYLFRNGKTRDTINIFPIIPTERKKSRAYAALLATDFKHIKDNNKDIDFHVIVHNDAHDSDMRYDDTSKLIIDDLTAVGLDVKKLKDIKPCLRKIRNRIEH